MGVPEHNLSQNAGDGAASDLNDKYDGEEYASKDQRQDTRTTFWESDIDKHCEDPRYADQLRRALKRQEGDDYGEKYRNDDRKTSNREEWKRRVVSTYASQLELTTSQTERVEHLAMDVFSIDSFGPYCAEEVILATVNVVSREYGRWIEDEEMFRTLMEDNGMNMDTMKSLRSLVRERIPSRS